MLAFRKKEQPPMKPTQRQQYAERIDRVVARIEASVIDERAASLNELADAAVL